RFQTLPVQLESHAVVVETLPFILDAGGDHRWALPQARTGRRRHLEQSGRRGILQQGEAAVAPKTQRQSGTALFQIAPFVGPPRSLAIPAVDSEGLGSDGVGGDIEG